jgi:DNA polymerase-3 subunit delta
LDYAGFLKAADAGAPPAVALLHGPEVLLLDDAVGRVTRGLFPDGGDLTLSREILDSRDAGVEGIVQAALLLPWTGSRRLVVARGIEELGARAADPLAGYCRAPNPSTVLMLLAPQALTATHWLHKAIPRPLAIAVQPPIGGPLVAWLRTRARAQGIELTEDAAALLVQLAGDDLIHLCGEVEKAALAGGADNRRVSVAEVRAVVGETRARHVFDLTRALVERDRAAALVLLSALLGAGEDPFALLGMLAREARAAWRAADGLSAGRSENEIARGLGRPPGPAAAMIERARALRPDLAARQLQRCWEAERRLKLGGAPRAELSLLIADLCAG